MASPMLSSFCCMLNNTGSELFESLGASPSDDLEYQAVVDSNLSFVHRYSNVGLLNWRTTGLGSKSNSTDETSSDAAWFKVYNGICLVSSLFSVFGAIYQLIPKTPANHLTAPSRGQIDLTKVLRQNHIICCLALADLLAALGVFIRSCLSLSNVIKLPLPSFSSADSKFIFCAFITAWVQYFYTCTYLWTFLYAVDVYRLATDKSGPLLIYHAIGWGLSAVFSATGNIFYFYPSSVFKCKDGWVSFAVAYVSIMLVMILNPILYYKASKAELDTVRSLGSYSDVERDHMAAVRSKFKKVIAVFYICWFPNVINGLVKLIENDRAENPTFRYILWFLMAALNPLQALFNSFVYKGVGITIHRLCYRNETHDRNSIASEDNSARNSPLAVGVPATMDLPGERTPLLGATGDRAHTSVTQPSHGGAIGWSSRSVTS